MAFTGLSTKKVKSIQNGHSNSGQARQHNGNHTGNNIHVDQHVNQQVHNHFYFPGSDPITFITTQAFAAGLGQGANLSDNSDASVLLDSQIRQSNAALRKTIADLHQVPLQLAPARTAESSVRGYIRRFRSHKWTRRSQTAHDPCERPLNRVEEIETESAGSSEPVMKPTSKSIRLSQERLAKGGTVLKRSFSRLKRKSKSSIPRSSSLTRAGIKMKGKISKPRTSTKPATTLLQGLRNSLERLRYEHFRITMVTHANKLETSLQKQKLKLRESAEAIRLHLSAPKTTFSKAVVKRFRVHKSKWRPLRAKTRGASNPVTSAPPTSTNTAAALKAKPETRLQSIIKWFQTKAKIPDTQIGICKVVMDFNSTSLQLKRDGIFMVSAEHAGECFGLDLSQRNNTSMGWVPKECLQLVS